MAMWCGWPATRRFWLTWTHGSGRLTSSVSSNLQQLWHAEHYYVRQIFSKAASAPTCSTMSLQADGGLYSVASLDERTHELVVTAVNTTAQVRAAEIKLDGLTPAGTAQVTTFPSADLKAENSFDHPTAVAPVIPSINVNATFLSVQLPAQSVTDYQHSAEVRPRFRPSAQMEYNSEAEGR